MLNVKKLQAIRDKILGVTVDPNTYGDLNSVVYLQQILDAVKGTDPLNISGNLAEHVYLQKILNAKRGVADGQFGSLPNSIYLQQLINAYNGMADGQFGSLSENFYLDALIAVAGSAVAPTVTYLLRDDFTTDHAAPLPSPRTAEPGPGIWTISDPANRAPITGSKVVVGAGAGTTTFQHDHGSAFTLPVGFVVDISQANGGMGFYLNANGITAGNPSLYRLFDNGLYVNSLCGGLTMAYVFSTATANAIRVGRVQFASYALVIYKDGGLGDGNPFNVACIENYTVAARYLAVVTVGAIAQAAFDNVRVFNSPATDLYSFAEANVGAGETQTTATVVQLFTFTYIAQAGVTQDVMFRRTDDNNCLLVRFDQAGGTVRFYKRVTGTETAIGSSRAMVQVAGNSYQVRVSAIGSRISWACSGDGADSVAEISNASGTGLKFSHAAANLKIAPATIPAASVINQLA